MPKPDLYRRVDEAVERGQAWRAKEILRGNVGSASYDSRLYERYGMLLLDLGEMVEAGKYLFLSGSRRPEYDEAIAVYLSRHPKSRPELLFRSFPSGARFRELHRYPLEVRRTLEERGLPQHFADLQRERAERWKRKRAQDPDGGLMGRGFGPGRWVDYAPLGHWHPHTPAQVGARLLLHGILGAVVLLVCISAAVGLAVIVRWIASLG